MRRKKAIIQRGQKSNLDEQCTFCGKRYSNRAGKSEWKTQKGTPNEETWYRKRAFCLECGKHFGYGNKRKVQPSKKNQKRRR